MIREKIFVQLLFLCKDDDFSELRILHALVDYSAAIVKYESRRKGCKGAGLNDPDGFSGRLQNLSCRDHPLVEHVILFL